MDHTDPAHRPDAAHGQQHPIGIYLKIWGLLFVLSTMSYMVDYFHVQGLLRWALIVVLMISSAYTSRTSTGLRIRFVSSAS